MVDDVRVRGVGRSPPAHRPTVDAAAEGHKAPEPMDCASCYWEGLGRVDTAVHKLAELKAGHVVEGESWRGLARRARERGVGWEHGG